MIDDDVHGVIRGCLTGDGTAWNAFFTEYAPIAMNILTHKLADLSLDEKEDIVQNVFSRLLTGGLKNFRGSSRYEFLAYFKKICMNESFSYLKSGKELHDAVSLDEERDDDPLEFRLSKTDYLDGGPHAGVSEREQLRIVEMVLDGSPVETKQVVLLKLEGWKDREIANILGISQGTVASKYARMRERIKKLFDDSTSG